jgi:LuxR family maltose regulon positive regulatory protein
MALVLWARGELDHALEHALEGTRLSERWGVPDILFMSYTTLARIQSDRREYVLALQAISRAKGIASELSPHYLVTAQSREAIIHLQNDNSIGASEWVQEASLNVSDTPDFHNLGDYRILGHIKVVQARRKREAIPETVIALLDSLVNLCAEIGAHGQAIEPLITLFLAYDHMDQKVEAHATLEKALHLAHAEGYIQPFLQSQSDLLATLRQLHREQKYRSFIDRILVIGDTHVKSTVSKKAALLLAEELSEREMDVLRYLPPQLSTNEIAQELYVATSTVRSHIKSIYGKLAVHSRREAVERAQELDLL